MTQITSGVFVCQLPEFVTLRRVWLSLSDFRIHTSWVCGSGDGTAEGFGFTGGIGGFGFMILREQMFTFQKQKKCYLILNMHTLVFKTTTATQHIIFTGFVAASGGRGLDGGSGLS